MNASDFSRSCFCVVSREEPRVQGLGASGRTWNGVWGQLGQKYAWGWGEERKWLLEVGELVMELLVHV